MRAWAGAMRERSQSGTKRACHQPTATSRTTPRTSREGGESFGQRVARQDGRGWEEEAAKEAEMKMAGSDILGGKRGIFGREQRMERDWLSRRHAGGRRNCRLAVGTHGRRLGSVRVKQGASWSQAGSRRDQERESHWGVIDRSTVVEYDDDDDGWDKAPPPHCSSSTAARASLLQSSNRLPRRRLKPFGSTKVDTVAHGLSGADRQERHPCQVAEGTHDRACLRIACAFRVQQRSFPSDPLYF